MNEYLSLDGPIMQFFAKLWDVILLSILFSVCCIPLVTFGVSCSALYYTMVRAVLSGEGQTVRTFFRGLRQNIGKGLVLGVLFEAVLAILLFSLYVVFINDLGMVGMLFGAAFLALLLIVLTTMAYAFPLLGRFENSVLGILANSFFIAPTQWRETVAMLILEIVLIVGILVVPFIPYFLLFLPGVIFWMQAKMLEPILAPYMQEGEKEDETETV